MTVDLITLDVAELFAIAGIALGVGFLGGFVAGLFDGVRRSSRTPRYRRTRSVRPRS